MARVMALVVLLVWAAGAGGCISSRWRSGDADYVSHTRGYRLLASFPPVTFVGDQDYVAVLGEWESGTEPRISMDGGLGLSHEEFIEATAYLRDAELLFELEELTHGPDHPAPVVWTGWGLGFYGSNGLGLADANFGVPVFSALTHAPVAMRQGVAYRLRITIRNARSDAPVTLTPRLWVLGFRFVL